MGQIFQQYDGLTPDIRRLANVATSTRGLMYRMGKAIEGEHRAHFRLRDQQPNKRGFPKRHFWRSIQQATALSSFTERSAVVTIADPRLLHKITGGTLTAKRARMLAIPVSPRAYKVGSPRIFGKPLSLIVRKGKPALLVEQKKRQWDIHYVLKRSVYQQPDPNALPAVPKVQAAINAAAQAWARSQVSGRG